MKTFSNFGINKKAIIEYTAKCEETITKIAILQDRPYQEVVDEAVNECMGTTNKLLDVLEAKLSRPAMKAAQPQMQRTCCSLGEFSGSIVLGNGHKICAHCGNTRR